MGREFSLTQTTAAGGPLLVVLAQRSKVSSSYILGVKRAVFKTSASFCVCPDAVVDNIDQRQCAARVPGPIKQNGAVQIVEQNRVEHTLDCGDRQADLFSTCRFQWLCPGVEREV